MDQGIAATLGAGIGIAGTLGASYLTYAATRHQTRAQIHTEQVRWLRDERKTAYLAFLDEAEKRVEELQGHRRRFSGYMEDAGSSPEWEHERQLMQEWYDQLVVLRRLITRVSLAGPRSVGAAALGVWAGITTVHLALFRLCRGEAVSDAWTQEYERSTDRLFDAQEQFTNEARKVFEEPPL
ncbi:hypothetical protein ACFY1L_55330 [Streptomyces sp. NPDC001663]|uniref:hypothetical protein n=1 Tax=Streptomyces sp. NPDC001663 TaxID=3364597 RepID=UPI0036B266CB